MALVATLVGTLVFPACSQSEERPEQTAETTPGCVLPPETPELDVTALPVGLRESPADDVRRLIEFQDGFTATVVVDGSVEDALDLYRGVVGDAGYSILSEDFEGFEAEIFFNSPKEVGTVRIRETSCPDKTLAYVRLVRAS